MICKNPFIPLILSIIRLGPQGLLPFRLSFGSGDTAQDGKMGTAGSDNGLKVSAAGRSPLSKLNPAFQNRPTSEGHKGNRFLIPSPLTKIQVRITHALLRLQHFFWTLR